MIRESNDKLPGISLRYIVIFKLSAIYKKQEGCYFIIFLEGLSPYAIVSLTRRLSNFNNDVIDDAGLPKSHSSAMEFIPRDVVFLGLAV